MSEKIKNLLAGIFSLVKSGGGRHRNPGRSWAAVVVALVVFNAATVFYHIVLVPSQLSDSGFGTELGEPEDKNKLSNPSTLLEYAENLDVRAARFKSITGFDFKERPLDRNLDEPSASMEVSEDSSDDNDLSGNEGESVQ